MIDVKPDQLVDLTVETTGGDKIGKVTDVYLDTETQRPEWVRVKTGMLGKDSLVPLAAATRTDDAIAVPFTKDQVKDAPHQDPARELSPEDEAELFTYYGVPYGGDTVTATGGPITTGTDITDTTGTAAPTGHDTSGPNTDSAMTRSEEHVEVGTRQVETGKVRLRKYVVTENVTQTVPVSHEEVRIEREPITEASAGAALDGPAISEEEHEVTLHGEVPVVAKEAVPVERVRLETDTVTEQATVDETVRKERIETDGDTGTTRP